MPPSVSGASTRACTSSPPARRPSNSAARPRSTSPDEPSGDDIAPRRANNGDMDQVSDFFTKTKIDGWDVILAVVVVIASFFLARAARHGTLGVFARIKGVPPETGRMA